jgi:hypothetical protein
LDDVQLTEEAGTNEMAQRIKRQWSFWYPRKIPNLVEKSISNATRMPFLEAHFQPAYFIYIVRNGYAVAEGIRRRANLKRWRNPIYSDTYPIELCAEQWCMTDELVEQYRTDVKQLLKVYYEDLVANPIGVMEKITSFLGLSSISDDVLRGQWVIDRFQSPIQNMNEKSLQRLSPGDFIKIEEVAGTVLHKNGYERPLIGMSA